MTPPPPTALLYKPVDRVTRSTLVLHVSQAAWRKSGATSRLSMKRVQGEFLHLSFFFFLLQDLLKHTPSGHPDHPLLQDALRISQNFLSSINEEITPRRQSMTVKKGEVSVESRAASPPHLSFQASTLEHLFPSPRTTFSGWNGVVAQGRGLVPQW